MSTITEDPAIAAVRDVRHKISASVGHDPKKLVDYYRQLQKRFGKRVIPQPAKDAKAGGDDSA